MTKRVMSKIAGYWPRIHCYLDDLKILIMIYLNN